MAFATFAVPSILAALGYLLVQEKYGSFDKLVEDDQVHGEFTENVNERVIQS